MHSMLGKIGKIIFRFDVFIILGWSIAIAFFLFFGRQLSPLLSEGGWIANGSSSKIASEKITKEFEGKSKTSLMLVVKDPNHQVGTPKYTQNLQNLVEVIKKEKNLQHLFTWLDAPKIKKGQLVGKDKHTSLGFIGLNIDEDHAIKILPKLQKELVSKAKSLHVKAYLVGNAPFLMEVNAATRDGLIKAELITLPIGLLILLFVFRTIVSALTPLFIGFASVGVTLGIIYFIAQQYELSLFIANAVSMLGLGIGIDYSLIMVNRFKEELSNGKTVQQAIIHMMSTAGHSVLFSGITVVTAMSLLFLVDLNVIQSIAVGSAIVVFISLLAALSLLPAILSVLGRRILWGKIPFLRENTKQQTFWYCWTHQVIKRPILSLVIALLVLGAMAWPSLHMKSFLPDNRILPENSVSREGYDVIQSAFGAGYTAPVQVVISGKDQKVTDTSYLRYVEKLSKKLKNNKQVKQVTSITTILPSQLNQNQKVAFLSEKSPLLSKQMKTLMNQYVSRDKKAAIIEVIPTGFASSQTTRQLVDNIRNQMLPSSSPPQGVQVNVGGETAEGIDSTQKIEENLLPVMVAMLLLGYFLLLLTFRSVLLPLKAILLNLLSLGATYGLLTLVFAEGWGASLLGVESLGYNQNFIPILLLAILFSLSTDYEVFLLDRVKEEYQRTHDTEESVAIGMAMTAPMISGAALIMIAVCGAFVFASILPIQELGFGMAVGIAIDATIIRFLIVPVTMKILGHWNWWIPGQKPQNKYLS